MKCWRCKFRLTVNLSRNSTGNKTSAILNQFLSFGFQAYSDTAYTGTKSEVFDDPGLFHLGFMAHSYVWQPDQSGCCATICRNLTIKGWRCKQTTSADAPEPFDVIFIGCGARAAEVEGRCD